MAFMVATRSGCLVSVEALGFLVGTYWQALYRYARRKGKSPGDAEDLVQGFLTHVIEARALRGTDPSKGRSELSSSLFRLMCLVRFRGRSPATASNQRALRASMR